MSSIEKRTLHRDSGSNLLFPVSCVLRGFGKQYVAEVVNYHFKGACLRTENIPEQDRERIRSGEFKLDFYLGQVCLQSDIAYRVSWRDEGEAFVFGVEFQNKIASNIERAERFVTNAKIPVQISSKDPLDPHRTIFFNALDVSETGMLLKTSLANKHLLPGMKLVQVKLQIPSLPTVDLELFIENTRPGAGDDHFLLGVSIRDKKREYIDAIRSYLPLAVPHFANIDQHLQRLTTSPFSNKKLKNSLTYKIVQTPEQYKEVLKLRFIGYGKHNKIRSGTTWQDQGEGLEKEGVILGGYMGSQVVCSMELRFGDSDLPLRVEKLVDKKALESIDLKRVVEINKLVIHPQIQGSDLVLGLFQRAHTIVINRGQLDVLGFVTDKLKPLYEGIGATCIGVRFPHMFIEDEFLNVVLLKREIYHDSLRFNPYAWSIVYKTIHEHYEQLGLVKKHAFSFKDRIVATATRIMVTRKKSQKHQARQNNRKDTADVTSQSAPATSAGSFIDPKWTRQELAASVMLPYIREGADMIGEDKVAKILQDIGISEKFMTKAGNWLSVAFLDTFLDRFSEFGDVGVLSRRAGIRSMKRDMLGLNYFFLKHLLTPKVAYATFSKVMPKFNRTRTYEIKIGPGRATIAVGLVAQQLLPRHEESCQNWEASFKAYVELMTGRTGRIKKTSCCYRGDKACEYELLWHQGYKELLPILPVATASVASLATYLLYNGQTSEVSLAAFCAFVSVLLLFAYLRVREVSSDYDTSNSEFLKYQQDANDRYAELQVSKSTSDDMYREARMVEQVMRDIQQKDDVGSLLQTALDAACNTFRFDRGFAMLVDENRKMLRTAAVAGASGNLDSVWKFAVDVSVKRENAMLLSSVYHSGTSVVINDIESHMFQINEASKAIVRQFGSAGFIMVSIPAKVGSWGVLIIDKKSRERVLGRRDIVVLERLSQQIGIALDKRSDLERERSLRTQFQRFAPAALLHSSENDKQQSTVGAQLRRIGVLFVDIRGFTKMSETLPPTKMLETLNGFFSLIDPIVRKHGGIVDKYLGDGALITWGTLGSSAPNTDEMIQCSIDILTNLSEHNRSLVKNGLPTLKIGIGLHVGDALVGTVGSSERLEYTAIGPAVNLASRMESLCKVYDSEIVMSEEMVSEHIKLSSDPRWHYVQNVEVRGIARKVNIWTYRTYEHTSTPNSLYKGTAA